MLGRGSMGTVWSAYDEHLQRPVAIKEVRLPGGFPESAASQLRERTLREARAIAMLAHPNVIVLHDVASAGGEPFVVMELLSGRSVADLVAAHGPLSSSQAAGVADAVAAALETAHHAGITHRDVKPSNVLLGEGGQIKLTDFGIARNVSEDTMTGTGVMLGSPAYIAPEVAAGAPASPAADLWGLGAMLFTAVEGVPPYDADGDPLETVGQVVHGELPQPTSGPLAGIISGLMVKDPAERMPLAEVRTRVFPLLDTPAHKLFTPQLLGITETTGENAGENAADAGSAAASAPAPTNGTGVDDRAAQDQQDTSAPPHPTAAGDESASSGELAADPGPLPFTPTSPPPGERASGTRRGPARATALVVVSVVLFLAAAVGGFAATRFVGDRPLLPAQPEAANSPTPTAEPTFELASRDGDAASMKGVPGGRFSIDVPREWRKFVASDAGKQLPRSTLVQFVSPDGARTLRVRQFGEYFPQHNIDDYLRTLRRRWNSKNFVAVDRSSPPSGDAERTVTYRTVQHAAKSESDDSDSHTDTANRTTIARLLHKDNSLWVIDVTVPTDEETVARSELFNRIVPTFKTTG